MVMDTLGDTLAKTEVKTLRGRKARRIKKFCILETIARGRVAGRCNS